MKIWILASKFGQGHWSAAEALKEKYEAQNHEVIISDVIEITHPLLHKTIYTFFKQIICRFTPFYNFVNHFGRNPKKEMKVKKRLHQEYEKIKPDLIYTTWSKAARMLGSVETELKVVVTDFGVHRGWLSSAASVYIVADESVKKKLMSYGIHRDIIEVKGIPVKKQFYHRSKASYGKKNILIMGGGLGICPWVEKLLEKITLYPHVSITVITGNNEALFKKIRKKYPSVNTVGFTKEMHKYLKEASLVISKPGGVSLAESIAIGVPFIAIYPTFDHEIENATYIETHHYGAVIRKGESIEKKILQYLEIDAPLIEPINFIDKEVNRYDMAL